MYVSDLVGESVLPPRLSVPHGAAGEGERLQAGQVALLEGWAREGAAAGGGNDRREMGGAG